MDEGGGAVGGDAGVDRPSWGPRRSMSVVTAVATLAALGWRLLDPTPENRLVAEVLVVAFALVTLALVRIRVRLRVIAGGIAVTGPLRTRSIPWSRVRTISTPTRGRFGRRAALLELEIRPDAGDGHVVDPRPDGSGATSASGDPADDALLVFGRFDLGVDPARVGRVLLRLLQADRDAAR